MPKRTRLAPGVYQDAFGISVIYQGNVAGERKPIETRFEVGSSIDRLTRWRARQIQQDAELSPKAPRNALARDAVRYLKRLKGLPSYGSERSHLLAWLRELGPMTRHALTRDRCEAILAKWRQAGYAARTLRHRHRLLVSLYKFFDGPHAITPLDEVKRPKRPRPRPVSVADTVITEVALQLRKHELLGTLPDGKTRARFLVRATTGRRPAELMRARPEDVDLERRLWFTRTAKDGLNTIVYLNDEMFAAWHLFAQVQAWGPFDCTSFAKTVRRAGWPKWIRPYNLRHSTGMAIRARGGDLEDVQDQLGHASIDTAREFYLHALPARQRAVSAKLAGRFEAEAFLATTPAPAKARLPVTKKARAV